MILKKIVCIIFLGAFMLNATGQKYTKYTVVPESTIGACDAKVLFQSYNTSISSIYFFDAYREHLLSTIPYADGLCNNIRYPFTYNDTACFYVEDEVFIYSDTALQPQFDTVYVTMPDSGICNGTLNIVFSHTQAYHEIILYGPSGGVTYTTPGNYDSLCDGQYTIVLYDNNLAHGVYDMDIDLRNNPEPCVLYSVNVLATSTTGIACNGAFDISTVGGIDTLLFQPHIYFNHADIDDIYSLTPDSLCEGLYEIFIENYQPSGSITNQFRHYSCYYLGNGAPPIEFGIPLTIPLGTDTVNLPPVSNCDIDYTIAIDTAYVDAYTFIDTSQFQVDLILIQGIDTFNFSYIVAGDTSISYFLNFTIFCNDPLRAPTGYYEFMMFHHSTPDILASVNEKHTDNALTVFPNPANNFIRLLSPNIKTRIEIWDVNGACVMRIENYQTGNDINISSLASGFYSVMVKKVDGDFSALKFIKSK